MEMVKLILNINSHISFKYYQGRNINITKYYITKFIKAIDIEFSNALCNIQICEGIVVY